MHEVARVTDHKIANLLVPVVLLNQNCLYAAGALPVSAWPLVHWVVPMVEDQDYFARSQHFENLAAGSADPIVAAAYRTLAAGYRVLDYWHQRWRRPPDPPNPNGPDEQP
jgi:hypothetical protein